MLPDRASTIVNLQQLVSGKRTTWLLQIGFLIGCYEGENLGNGMAAVKSASIKGGYYCNLSRFVRRPLAISRWHDGAEWWSALKVLFSAFPLSMMWLESKMAQVGFRFKLTHFLFCDLILSFSFFVSLSSFLSFSKYRLDQNGQSLWIRVLQFYLLKRISPLKFIFGLLTRIETSKLLITYKF